MIRVIPFIMLFMIVFPACDSGKKETTGKQDKGWKPVQDSLNKDTIQQSSNKNSQTKETDTKDSIENADATKPTLVRDSAFYTHPPEDSNMLHVTYRAYNSETSSFNKDSLYTDTILPEDFESMPFYDFNYYKLKSEMINQDTLVLFNDSISIKIVKAPFDTSQASITYHNKPAVKAINGHPVIGTDADMPRDKIANISVEINEEKIPFSDTLYHDLYEPNLGSLENGYTYTKAYTDQYGRVIFYMRNSDAAGSYFVFWIIKDGKVNKRVVDKF